MHLRFCVGKVLLMVYFKDVVMVLQEEMSYDKTPFDENMGMLVDLTRN